MGKKLMLDAGHGLTTGGKQTCNGSAGIVKEWTMSNNVCNYIKAILADYDVENLNVVTGSDTLIGQMIASFASEDE